MLAESFAMATVPAENIDRAVDFYTNILGLKHVDTPSEGTAIFEAGKGSQIFIYQRGRSTAEHTAIHFIVDDIDKVVNELIERGVTLNQYDEAFTTDERGIAVMGPAKMAWLTDPEGNSLGLLSM